MEATTWTANCSWYVGVPSCVDVIDSRKNA
jgi:hypothetical protein